MQFPCNTVPLACAVGKCKQLPRRTQKLGGGVYSSRRLEMSVHHKVINYPFRKVNSRFYKHFPFQKNVKYGTFV